MVGVVWWFTSWRMSTPVHVLPVCAAHLHGGAASLGTFQYAEIGHTRKAGGMVVGIEREWEGKAHWGYY